MLTTALVVVSAGYAWWQGDAVTHQKAAALAAMQIQAAPAQGPAPMIAAPAPLRAAPDPTPPANTPPEGSMASRVRSTVATTAAPQTRNTPSQNILLPATPPPSPPALTGMAAIQNYIPTEGISPPLPPTTGTPDPGAVPSIPAGSQLVDGEYESERVQFEWGDLRVKIFVTGGKITGVQIMSYPDHRSQSLYLIQMADPILNSEVIKTQQAKVDIVSTATSSSYAYQDAVASAIAKATR
jgi:uncharacterized protein with FMN-binding domain